LARGRSSKLYHSARERVRAELVGEEIDVDAASLGTLIRSGYDLIFAGIWVTLLPGLTLVTLLVAVTVLGDALRDALDPRLASP
jgi:ABC-type dipeptide/oligopeptide/nickel transport system permease subunit